MKKIITTVMIAVAAMSARADLLYFMADAFDWTGAKTFDFAMIGVANAGTGANVDYLYIQSSPDSSADASIFLAPDSDNSQHATGWANFGDYAQDGYVFYVETYLNSSSDPIWTYSPESAKSYQQLVDANHVYIPGVTAPQNVSVWAVPEPTSGLLLLLGVAGLALLRKRKVAALVPCVALLLPLASFAGVDDTLITFSTKGPDTYLDGTTVKDGECYALVWTAKGATFGGFSADGAALGEGSEVLVYAPLAKGGRCPTTLFELDATLAAQYADGTYALYLVDTRLADGTLGGVNAAGAPSAVNGYGAVTTEASSAVAVTAKSALPANAPKPQITAIKVIGDNVFLSVRNTAPCLQYKALEVAVDGSAAGEKVGAPVQGSAEGEVTIIVPKKGASGFYSVDRN